VKTVSGKGVRHSLA